MKRRVLFQFIVLSFISMLLSCNTLKYVPEDQALLNRSKVIVESGAVSRNELKSCLRQQPNRRLWGIFGVNLGLYNLSGSDTTVWMNRFLRRMGEEPVIYDSRQSEWSRLSMERYLEKKGYFDGEVELREIDNMRKMETQYIVRPGEPYRVHSYQFPRQRERTLDSLVSRSLVRSQIQPGVVFDIESLDKERERLTQMANNLGYYAVNKDHFNFLADTTEYDHEVVLDLQMRPFSRITSGNIPSIEPHSVYRIRNVYFLLDVPTTALVHSDKPDIADYDTIPFRDYYVIYRDRPFLRPQTLCDNCFILPGSLYRARAVNQTYSRLNALQNLKYVNIRFVELPVERDSMEFSISRDSVQSQIPSERDLDCLIVLTPAEDNIFSFDVEGTNTAGDLGIAGTVSYSHQNVFRGGEVMNARFRGAYEALSSSFANDYFEYGGELNFTLPDFRFPFVSHSFLKQMDAKTNFKLSYDNLSRPEFLRTTAAASMEYSLKDRQIKHTLNPLDIAYVYMPRVDSLFKATYLTDNSYLKHSYEDQLIVRFNYGILYSSIPQGISTAGRSFHTFRANFESAGNLLNLAMHQFGQPNAEGQYTIANIPFSQYVRGEFEFVQNHPLGENLRMAYRFGLGVAYPYGNSQILPFEKRFYSGGANSVRGWSVRTLGPGSYVSPLKTIDFMNQSGDMKLDLNLEFRHRWIGVLEGAYFIDAGNIWTLRPYDNQPGGQFQWDTFYQQLACSAGLGFRFDFNIVLARIDVGMKVYDPSGLTQDERWRIRHIDDWDDFALHIAIGYPF